MSDRGKSVEYDPRVKAAATIAEGRPKPTCLLVLGMHRSGTSALTRVLSLAGAKLPARLLGAGEGNEAGHWEPEALMAYHDQLLGQLGSAWHDWAQLDLSRLAPGRRQSIKDEIAEIIAEDFGDAGLIVVKEPRICRFVPMFIGAMNDVGFDVAPVIPVRNPLEVIDSLGARNSMARSDAVLLWLRHALDAEYATRGMSRAVVAYDHLLTDWRSAFDQIVGATGVRLPYGADEIAPDVEAFLRPELRHHARRVDDVVLDPLLRGWVSDAYHALNILSRSPGNTQALAQLDDVRNTFNRATPNLKALLAERQAAADAQVSELRQRTDAVQQERDQFAERLAALQGEAEQVQAELSTTVDSLKQTIEERSAALAQEQDNRAALEGALARVQQEFASQATRANATSQLVRAIEGSNSGQPLCETVPALVDALSSELDDTRDQFAEAKAFITDIEQRADVLQKEHDRSAERAAALQAQLDQVQARLTDQVETLQQTIEERSAALLEEQDNRAALEHALTSAQQELVDAQNRAAKALSNQQARAQDLEARLSAEQSRGEQLHKNLAATSQELDRVNRARTATDAAKHAVDRRHGLANFTGRVAARINLVKRSQLRRDVTTITSSRLFDRNWYLEQNPDVQRSGHDPAVHYLKHGWLEGRDPSPFFSTQHYLTEYADIALAGINPLVHFIEHGAREGRRPAPEASDICRREEDGEFDLVAGNDVKDMARKVLSRIKNVGQTELEQRTNHLRKFVVYPPQPSSALPSPPDYERLRITWIIPDFAPGAGGHMTIFRIARHLEEYGHHVQFLIQNPTQHNTGSHAKDTINKHFQPFDGHVELFDNELPRKSGDALIATDRFTTYPVNAMADFHRKFYFVQDYETLFYSTGTESLLTEATYSFELDCLCAGEWLEHMMRYKFSRWAMSFPLAYDSEIYNPVPTVHRSHNRIAFYARYVTPRRAVELGMMALDILAERGEQIEVDFFGWELGALSVDYDYTDHGICSGPQLAEIYRKATVGVVFSATNHSLVNKEMMACGLPVVDLDVESVQAVFPEGVLCRAVPTPEGIADAISSLLSQPARQGQLRGRGFEFIEGVTWEKSARQVEAAIKERVSQAVSVSGS